MTEGIQNVNATPRTSGRATAGCAVETTLSCSVVVCTRNRPDHLHRCLESLASLSYPRFDVLVVDNAPSDASANEVAERWGAKYIVEPRVGLSRARNLGACACSSDIVAFTDDDAVVDSEWLTNLMAEFSDPDVMAVTGRILPLEERGQPAELAAYVTDLGGERRILDRENPLWFEMASFGGIGKGGNMAFRRIAFEMGMAFDERLGRGTLLYGGEEQRALCSVVEEGFRVSYTPEAVVYHPMPSSLQEARQRYIKAVSASTAFMTLLLVETPYRWRAFKYLLEALCGKRRIWRCYQEKSPSALVPRWRRAFACLAGPLLYFRGRCGWPRECASRCCSRKS